MYFEVYKQFTLKRRLDFEMDRQLELEALERASQSARDRVGHHAKDILGVVPRWPCEARGVLSLLTSDHLSNTILFSFCGTSNWSGTYQKEGIRVRVCLEP